MSRLRAGKRQRKGRDHGVSAAGWLLVVTGRMPPHHLAVARRLLCSFAHGGRRIDMRFDHRPLVRSSTCGTRCSAISTRELRIVRRWIQVTPTNRGPRVWSRFTPTTSAPRSRATLLWCNSEQTRLGSWFYTDGHHEAAVPPAGSPVTNWQPRRTRRADPAHHRTSRPHRRKRLSRSGRTRVAREIKTSSKC